MQSVSCAPLRAKPYVVCDTKWVHTNISFISSELRVALRSSRLSFCWQHVSGHFVNMGVLGDAVRSSQEHQDELVGRKHNYFPWLF